MSGQAADRTRDYEVTPGADQDVCPLCGIWRMNAGWMALTCGEWFRQSGCLVAPESEAGDGE